MVQNPPKRGSIVQITKDDKKFKYCLAIVSESDSRKVMAYVQNCGSEGQAYIFLYEGEYEETGFSRQALTTAIKYLEDINWLCVYKNGRSNVYAINAEVAWKKHQDINYRAKFRAKIILDSSEQTHNITKTKQLVDLSDLQNVYGLSNN